MMEYNANVETFREREYPMIKDAIYLDHAGSALYAKSLIDRFTQDLLAGLYGNPHSGSASSQLSTDCVETTRVKVLHFLKADPEEFEVVFVANATAGIKLVMEAFRVNGFDYGYHSDSHTSLVGIRECAQSARCLNSDEVESWLSGSENLTESISEYPALFAYPAQSNLNGRQFPLSWPNRVRETTHQTYTLLDVSSYATTSPLDLSDVDTAADFTVLSFYKIFGFPDLGALIVRKKSGQILRERQYFGGGTVDMVLCIEEQWHINKTQSLHEVLEDGTLPFHNILALSTAFDIQEQLYGSMVTISKHVTFLAQRLFDGLSALRHANNTSVCVLYSQGFRSKEPDRMQGPIVAFNLKTSRGQWVSNVEFERHASIRNFHIRTGGHCNPGGIATQLGFKPSDMRKNYASGFRCSSETDIYDGKITGMTRLSIGAMSSTSDIDAFIDFVREFYVDGPHLQPTSAIGTSKSTELMVESMTIYPIKSCGGLSIPISTPWEIRPEGLAWDREWCLIHRGRQQALSQKRYPRMALIKPELDFQAGLLRIRYSDPSTPSDSPFEICAPLSIDPLLYQSIDGARAISSSVCGDKITAEAYVSDKINDFFSKILDVPCMLARFPAGGTGLSTRHAKPQMQNRHLWKTTSGIASPPSSPEPDGETIKLPLLLSNESPILVIHRASLDALNASIFDAGGKTASPSVFRANIVLRSLTSASGQEPYSEDNWSSISIGPHDFKILGPCQRCHMICIDQETGKRDEEPFMTLSKTRKSNSKIYFGSHMCHLPAVGHVSDARQPSTIRVGDPVLVNLT